MRTSTRLLVGLAAAGAVAAGGSAFTASNTLVAPEDNVAGYGEVAVTGATVSAVKHTLSNNSQYIVSSLVTFSSMPRSATLVRAGFGDAEHVTCTTTPTALQYSCSYGATSVSTSTANRFSVSVS